MPWVALQTRRTGQSEMQEERGGWVAAIEKEGKVEEQRGSDGALIKACL
jgi:hypothetical protein